MWEILFWKDGDDTVKFQSFFTFQTAEHCGDVLSVNIFSFRGTGGEAGGGFLLKSE